MGLEPAEMFQSPGNSGCLLVPVVPLPRGQQETAAMGTGNALGAHASRLSAAAWLLQLPIFQFPIGNVVPPLFPARSGCEGAFAVTKSPSWDGLGWKGS